MTRDRINTTVETSEQTYSIKGSIFIDITVFGDCAAIRASQSLQELTISDTDFFNLVASNYTIGYFSGTSTSVFTFQRICSFRCTAENQYATILSNTTGSQTLQTSTFTQSKSPKFAGPELERGIHLIEGINSSYSSSQSSSGLDSDFALQGSLLKYNHMHRCSGKYGRILSVHHGSSNRTIEYINIVNNNCNNDKLLSTNGYNHFKECLFLNNNDIHFADSNTGSTIVIENCFFDSIIPSQNYSPIVTIIGSRDTHLNTFLPRYIQPCYKTYGFEPRNNDFFLFLQIYAHLDYSSSIVRVHFGSLRSPK